MRLVIDRAVNAGCRCDIQPIEPLRDSGEAADRCVDRESGKSRLDVRTAGIVSADDDECSEAEAGRAGDVDTTVYPALEVRTIDVRRTLVSNVTAAQAGGKLVACPVRIDQESGATAP